MIIFTYTVKGGENVSVKIKNFKVNIDKDKLNQAIEEAANLRTYDVTCPFCKNIVNVPTGKSLCPSCGKEIDLTLNITHKS